MIRLRRYTNLIGIACSGLMLSACMHNAPAMRGERAAMISGRATAGYGENDAIRKTLTKAAAMTLDHGFRYFQIMSPIRPGVDVSIKLYRDGEIGPKTPGLWDAERVAQGDMGDITRLSEEAAPPRIAPPSATAAPAKPNGSAPNCTVYGCVW